jgi:hypothetical protein
MRRQRRISRASAVVAALALLLAGAGPRAVTAGAVPQYTSRFALDDCAWSNSGRNQYFSIRPGDWLLLEGRDDGELVRVQIKVLNDTKRITFTDVEGESLTVYARVVEEREWRNGELVEVSRNYFARCIQTGDIYLLLRRGCGHLRGRGHRESRRRLAGGDEHWPGRGTAGPDHARDVSPRLAVLPGGGPGVALDRAEHVKMGLTVKTPAGTFDECVEARETTPLEPGSVSTKIYCSELGLVTDNTVKLVQFHIAGFDD